MSGTLQSNAELSVTAPSMDAPGRAAGDLWVKADSLELFVYNNDLDGSGDTTNPANRAWVGVTTSQNTGSIIFSGPEPPLLTDIYPNVNVPGGTPLDPLPGTCWFDTVNNQLKIWYVQPTNDPAAPYQGQWVSSTTSHYLTEATNAEISALTSKVAELEQTVDELQEIVDGL